MPTSTLQAVRSQLVAVSAALPGTLHGVAVLQMITLVMGAADAGPKFGTGSGPWVVGLGLGLALGLAFGDVFALGDTVATPPDGELPRWARMKIPVPRSSRRTRPMTAGINQGGRSVAPLAGGLRATVGLRAGVGTGARSGVGAGATGAAATEAAAAAAMKGGAAEVSGGVGVPEGTV